jgi:hypothetical protein
MIHYNVGENNPFWRKVHKSETKQKLRMIRLGKKHSLEAKQKISIAIKRTRHLRIGIHAPAWKGGIVIDKYGYRLIFKPDHPKAVYGYVPEHRLIAEQALGRILRGNEIIHHINGNRADNKTSNLLICNRAYHRWLHRKNKKGGQNVSQTCEA